MEEKFIEACRAVNGVIMDAGQPYCKFTDQTLLFDSRTSSATLKIAHKLISIQNIKEIDIEDDKFTLTTFTRSQFEFNSSGLHQAQVL